MNAIVETATPELEAEAASVDTMLSWATAMTVTTVEEYSKAAEGLRRIKGRAAELDAKRKELTKPLDDLKKKWMDWFRTPLDKLARAESALKDTMLAFDKEQERIRREAERKAAEAAQRERERLAREAAALEQKAREQREAAEARAAALEAQGKAEKAAALRQQADEREAAKQDQAAALNMAAQAMPIAPVVDIPRATATGTSTREVWKYRIKDESKIPREYLVVDEKKLGAVVRAMKGHTNIPGVEAYPERTMSARSA